MPSVTGTTLRWGVRKEGELACHSMSYLMIYCFLSPVLQCQMGGLCSRWKESDRETVSPSVMTIAICARMERELMRIPEHTHSYYQWIQYVNEIYSLWAETKPLIHQASIHYLKTSTCYFDILSSAMHVVSFGMHVFL